VFHVELRQFPHVARTFNLDEPELRARVLDPWQRGEQVELGEHTWAPERARLKIYEGPELRPDEISMGRGWSNAVRSGEDVTDRLLRRAERPDAGASLAEFKQQVLIQCADGRIGIHQVLWLANEHRPEHRVSERLALAEQSVWELLHEGRVAMLRVPAGDASAAAEPVARDSWQPILLDWATWSDSGAPSVLLERTDRA
jgi:hypothetical protein